MNRIAAVFAMAAGLSAGAMAEQWTGFIIDEKCSTNAAMRGNVACAERCIKGGSPAVLVTDEGKVYKIADQKTVVEHAGKKVTITGKMDGESIKVDSVKAE
ncbi:MAG: DUF5818 domain-containing protein [Bryobacteraceae bacterium]|jgi:hypothetical protein